MQRRKLIKALACAAGYPALARLNSPVFAQDAYTGKLLVTVQLEGGVDVTSFCDPKTNVAGEPEINRWARTDEIRQAGNIAYAPYAGNSSFFDKYYQDMLVINGVDAQTNSHSVGIINNWSGRNADGFPSITALMAAVHAPTLPLTYLNFGGFGNTGGAVRSTVIDDVTQLKDIIFPNERNWEDGILRNQSDWDRIRALQAKNAQRMIAESNTPAGSMKNRELYMDAFARAESIKAFGNILPNADAIQPTRNPTVFSSTLHRQVQSTLLAFKSGVSIAADVVEQGFDTHQRHDEQHIPLLANATDAIDYLWTFAEELGLADRLVVVIGSDFGRTPFFNAADGKDHWPIGSYIVMERNAGFTNKVVGETDEGHNTLPINHASLQRDPINGEIIKPAHVHKALRKYLGLESSDITGSFGFTNTVDFSFFS